LKKNSIVCLILVGLLLSTFLVVNPVGAEDTDYQNISVHDARAMITQNPEIVILDVRNQSEYDMGYLTNAMFVPLYALEDASFGWLQPINGSAVRPNVNDTIIVYCLAGSRSAVACEMLAS
jgi:rhodanese-related sulfurtransferase